MRTEIVESLSGVSDADLDRVTRDAPVFLDRGWLRLCDEVDLVQAARGDVRRRYVLVHDADGLAAVCPALVARGDGLVSLYSLERRYFTGWQAQLLRMNPDAAKWAPWAIRAANAWRGILRVLGAGVRGQVLAISPLSFRGGAAVRPMDDTKRDAVLDAVIRGLQDLSRAEGLPLCVAALPDGDPLRAAAARAGFDETFFMYDNGIDTAVQDFDGWLARFPSKIRASFKKEIRTAADGYQIEATRDFGALADTIAQAYDTTYSKYGDDWFRHPPELWRALAKHAGEHATALVCRSGDDVVGFSLLLSKGPEAFVWRIGRFPKADGGEHPVYFSLCMYETIRLSVARGVRTLWLSGGAWAVKKKRGAKGSRLASAMWYPTLRSRWLLRPWVRKFGEIGEKQVARVVAR